MKDIYDVLHNYNFNYNANSVYILNYKKYEITISLSFTNDTYNFKIDKKNCKKNNII